MNAFDSAKVKIGNAVRGRAVMEGKGACMKCHRVGGTGSRVAPDLSEVGSARSAGSLYRSLTEPSAQMMPINRPVKIAMKNGTTVTGRRLNEDTYSIQIIDDSERLRTVLKSDVRDVVISTTSPMPSFKGALTDEELADVVAYLLSLKGQQS
jgi:putative heme-binding domain-containing protein